MNDTIETTLLLNLFYFENGAYSRNDNFIEAKRRKAIAFLDEDSDELKAIDQELAEEYQETISYLESLSDEEYESLKEELIERVSLN